MALSQLRIQLIKQVLYLINLVEHQETAAKHSAAVPRVQEYGRELPLITQATPE